MKIKKLCLALAAVCAFGAGGAQAATEIQWWYSNAGAIADQIKVIVSKFNASQSDYKVVAVYKGGYEESMTAAIAAFRSGKAPHILQVFEVGTAKFEFGVSQLPYYPDVKGAPQNTIIGGASLWVMAGHKPAEYKGVAKFFTFLSSPEIQAEWHQKTGYVQLTTAAYELSRKQGFYEANPGTDVAIQQLLLRNPTVNSKGVRLGNFVQIRGIIDEELESVWAQKKGPKQALDDAVKRGNAELLKFEGTNKPGRVPSAALNGLFLSRLAEDSHASSAY
jgi:ABC-type glycerol-3-phosphate transport system substrate-binding protein